jgi:hypothetical protein
MILPTGPVRVLMATRPVGFRKGMDGLAALVREQLKADPINAGAAAAARCRLPRGLPIVTGPAGFTRIRGNLLGFTRPEAGWDVST